MRLLIAKNDALSKSRDKFGRTALSFAAANGQESVVILLLARNNADITTEDIFGLSPLSLATKGGHYDIRNLLLQGANQRGIPVQKDTSLGISSEPSPLRTTCIFCMLKIKGGETCHRCSSCHFDDRNFDICQACVAKSLRCLDTSHEIIVLADKIEV